MGFEYTIKFKYESSAKLDELLRRINGFEDVESQYDGYRFRSANNQGKIPDAEVRIQNGGIYICVFGGDGSRVLKDLIAVLLAEYNQVTAEKLEWE